MFLRFICLFFCATTLAQEISVTKLLEEDTGNALDSVAIKSLISSTFQLKKSGSYEDAYTLNKWLLKKIDSAKTPYQYAEALYMQSRIEIDLGTYKKSIASTKRAKRIYSLLDLKESIAAANNLIGVGFYLESQLDSTLYYYQESYKMKRELKVGPEQLAISAYNIGIVYEDLAQYQDAIATYGVAVDYLKQVEDIESSFLPSVYLAMANTYNGNNNIKKAEEYTTLALTEGTKIYGADNPEMSFVYESNSAIHKVLGDYKKAKFFAYRALEIREKYYGKTHRWTTQSYADIAELLIKTYQLDSATVAIKKAISVGEKVDNKLDLADVYLIKAEILNKKGQREEALPLILKSRNLYTEVYGNTHEFVAQAHLMEANTYGLKGDSVAALRAIDATLESARYNKEDLNTLVAPFVAIEALSLKFSHVSEAQKMSLIDEEIALINLVRRLYHSHEAKVFFANTTKIVLSNAVDYCYTKYAESSDGTFFEKALELVQLNTNSVLAEERQIPLQNESSPEAKQSFEHVLDLRRAWARANQSLYYEETASSPDKRIVDSLLNERVVISRQLDSAIVSYNTVLKNKAQEIPAVTVGSIIEKLRPNEQVVQYYVGSNYGYVFMMNREEVMMQRLVTSEILENGTMRLRDKLLRREAIETEITQLSQALKTAEIPQSKTEVTIFADGALSYVPFEILKAGNGKMMLEQHALRYEPALSLWERKDKREVDFDVFWSGFGVSYTGAQQLPKGIEEIKTISNLTKGTTFLNEEVTKEVLFEQGKKSQVLHLALHGIAETSNPLYSKFLLQDGEVTASEIYNSNIKSDLIVLSACETGYGTIENGEGVMSLSRAFTFAGAGSTVMSLWEVPDAQTAELMILFYKYLEAGETKDMALSNAKLEYIKLADSKILKHPYYWAGFVISGDVAALDKGNPELNYLKIVGILLLLVVGVFSFIKIRKRFS